MGRIKSTMVKKAAKQLMEGDSSFSGDFTNNKKILGNNTMPSKPIRNKVAGYIGRLAKMKIAGPRIKKIVPIAREFTSRSSY